ncbi:hypothetical protein CIW50_23210, partial [Tardiphaga sp. P9-11]
MNAPVLLAQLAGSTTQTPPSPKNLKLEKPQNGQAVTVHLDGNTKLDFADVASEKLTFVRVGEKLIILFDNQSTVTVDPVFDSMGKPLTDLAFDMGSDRTLTGEQFAQTFPITTDQSVLPAAGGATGPTGGANFGDATVGALGASGARLALLTGEDGGGGFSTLDDGTPNPSPIPGGVTAVTLNEDGFAEGNLGGTGDTGGTATSVTGSLNVDFGTDFVNRSFAFSLNQPTLAGLTSDGQTVQLAFTTVNGQPVMIGYVGGDFTVAANQVFTVSLDASSLQGSYTFTLLRPLDHPIHGTEDTINLSINVIATDGSGDTAPVTISIGINDDTPVIGTPTEAGLTDPLSGNPATQTGSLGISWGADRYNDHVDGGVSSTTGGTGDRSVIFGAASVAVTDASGNGIASLTSNGETVHYVLLNNGTALVAYTGDTAPSALPGSEVADNIVFVVTLSDASSTGSYTITQYQPLDHVSGDQALGSLNLTFQYTATDSDGDSVSGTVTTVVTDTVPTLGESVAAHTVGEDGLPGANVSGPEGGFDAANNVSVTGALNVNWNADSDIRHDGDTYGRTLSFLTSGETPTAIAGGSATISSLNLTITGEAGTALMSGGVALQYVVTANADGGETLTAYKGTPGEGNAVFTLVLDPTSTHGSYTFTLLGELDHGAESNSIGLTFAVQAADADGDTINTSFVLNVEDDVPVAHSVTASRVLDDEAQTVFTPTNPGTGFLNLGDVSPNYNSVTGAA